MKFLAQDFLFLARKRNENRNTYDMFAYSKKMDIIFCVDCIEEEALSGVDHAGNSYHAQWVHDDLFFHLKKLFSKTAEKYPIHPEDYFAHEDESEEMKDEWGDEEEKHPPIPAERVLQGIKGELTLSELDDITGVAYERGKYFCYEDIVRGLQAFLDKKMTTPYFEKWLCHVTSALYSTSYKEYGRKEKCCRDAALRLGSLSYGMDEYGIAEREVLQCIAELKYLYYIFSQSHLANIPPFYTKEKVLVFMSHVSSDYYNHCYQLFLVDENAKKYHVRYVINPIFANDVEYIFASQESFADLPSEFSGYTIDPDMNISEYLMEAPYIKVQYVEDDDEEAND